MSQYTRFRTVTEARAEAARHDAFLHRQVLPPTREELERERETLDLRRRFAEIDLRVHDDYSLSGCRRNAPEGS